MALIEAAGFEWQVLVVDNASKQPFVLPKGYKNVQVIRSDTNLGFSGGNNLGMATASREFNPDYFLLLNPDTLVQPDFLVKLYQGLKQHPDWGVTVPKIYFAPGCEFYLDNYKKADRGKVIWYAGGTLDWDNLLAEHIGVDELDRGQFDREQVTDFATGCCVLARREVLATTGVFDERYFLYFEDADLSWRIRRAGFELGYIPEAVVWHKNGSATQGSGSDLQTFYLTRNRLLFFATHGNWLVKQRVYRLAWRLWRHGSRVEKLAAGNFVRRKFGKQLAI